MKKLFLFSILSGFLFAEAPLYTISGFGKPSISRQNLSVSVAQEMGINVAYINLGCRATGVRTESQENILAKKYYDKKFGPDWLNQIERKTAKKVLSGRKDILSNSQVIVATRDKDNSSDIINKSISEPSKKMESAQEDTDTLTKIENNSDDSSKYKNKVHF